MNQSKLNFVFFGTPDVASETLEILKGAGYVPSLIVTSPDKPQGRKMLLTPPPAKVWAEKNKIPFVQPENLEELTANISSDKSVNSRGDEKYLQQAELYVVAAYGKIIPEKIINMPKHGSINVHYSLLPKYRGASPVESAILNGDTTTGVSIQKMIYKMDAGDVIASHEVSIGPVETAPELRNRLIKLGGNLLVKTLPEFLNGHITPIPQDELGVTLCKKIKKEDGLFDLNDDPVKNYNKFRAYATWPRTYFFSPPTDGGKRIIITKARLENNKFVIEKVIPEGGKEVERRIST